MARKDIGDVLREAGGALGAFGTQRRLSRQEEEERIKEEKAARLLDLMTLQLPGGGTGATTKSSVLGALEGGEPPPIQTLVQGKGGLGAQDKRFIEHPQIAGKIPVEDTSTGKITFVSQVKPPKEEKKKVPSFVDLDRAEDQISITLQTHLGREAFKGDWNKYTPIEPNDLDIKTVQRNLKLLGQDLSDDEVKTLFKELLESIRATEKIGEGTGKTKPSDINTLGKTQEFLSELTGGLIPPPEQEEIPDETMENERTKALSIATQGGANTITISTINRLLQELPEERQAKFNEGLATYEQFGIDPEIIRKALNLQ